MSERNWEIKIRKEYDLVCTEMDNLMWIVMNETGGRVEAVAVDASKPRQAPQVIKTEKGVEVIGEILPAHDRYSNQLEQTLNTSRQSARAFIGGLKVELEKLRKFFKKWMLFIFIDINHMDRKEAERKIAKILLSAKVQSVLLN